VCGRRTDILIHREMMMRNSVPAVGYHNCPGYLAIHSPTNGVIIPQRQLIRSGAGGWLVATNTRLQYAQRDCSEAGPFPPAVGDTMRTLFCLVLVWSASLSDAKAQTTNNSQPSAVAAIRKLGGKVTFDEKNPGKPPIGVSLSQNPLDEVKVTDAGLVHLKGMTGLGQL